IFCFSSPPVRSLYRENPRRLASSSLSSCAKRPLSREGPERAAPMLASFASRNRAYGAPPYHDDFETPGISPRSANCRKQSRQMPNLRRYARGRPQILQRLCLRVENFGFFTFCGLTLLSAASFTLFAVVAT